MPLTRTEINTKKYKIKDMARTRGFFGVLDYYEGVIAKMVIDPEKSMQENARDLKITYRKVLYLKNKHGIKTKKYFCNANNSKG